MACLFSEEPSGCHCGPESANCQDRSPGISDEGSSTVGFSQLRHSDAIRGCSPEKAHPQLGQNSSKAFAVVDKGVT
jgi:hypothetical protein